MSKQLAYFIHLLFITYFFILRDLNKIYNINIDILLKTKMFKNKTDIQMIQNQSETQPICSSSIAVSALCTDSAINYLGTILWV